MDQAAFRSFYQKTAPALRAYIARRAGSIDIADDILQDVFMRYLLKPPQVSSEAALRGYLYRTAETIVVDRWRQRQRESTRDRAAAELQSDSVHPDLDSDIDRAFRELTPQQCSLLWMAYVEEFDHREIAAAAAVKEKSVRVLLSRARKALARTLARLELTAEVADGNRKLPS
jgi:RNA polymerase sigma factor (sigma-70 family)